jgi:predicted DNA-binding protein (MmcQ/YjbR family)
MNIESFREYCLNLRGSTEDFPFDDQTLAFRVGGKIYALADVEHFEFVNLKCDPEQAILLREEFDAVKPGYHMNKKHWNSVFIDGSLPDSKMEELIRHSYEMVLKSLPLKQRNTI